MNRDGVLLLQTLRESSQALAFEPEQWNQLLECARRHALLGRLSVVFKDVGLLDGLPETVCDILADARAAVQANQTAQRYEANRVLQALRGLDVPVILLKGGAYLIAGLPPSRGRVSGDLDILVPRARLPEVERAMLDHGWHSPVIDAYDQKYYREWSHQIPPLRHEERDSELDIHHTIAPPTGRPGPEVSAILRDALPVEGQARLFVLCSADMVLHSAVHLFNEQMGMALRDLVDLHDLIGHFGRDLEFWPALLEHAARHGAQRPLYYCARYCRRYLGTEIPAEAARGIEAFAPNILARGLMDMLVAATLVHVAPDRRAPGAAFARWLLFVRAHWLRMPPGMLLRHLLVKATRRARPEPDAEPLPRP